LLFAALAAWLTTLPPAAAYALLVAQGVVFSVGWLFTSAANDFGTANPFMILFAVVFLGLLGRVVLAEPAVVKAVAATNAASEIHCGTHLEKRHAKT
jgi:hypothetical protein